MARVRDQPRDDGRRAADALPYRKARHGQQPLCPARRRRVRAEHRLHHDDRLSADVRLADLLCARVHQPHAAVLREEKQGARHRLLPAPARRRARHPHAVLLHPLRRSDGACVPRFQHQGKEYQEPDALYRDRARRRRSCARDLSAYHSERPRRQPRLRLAQLLGRRDHHCHLRVLQARHLRSDSDERPVPQPPAAVHRLHRARHRGRYLLPRRDAP